MNTDKIIAYMISEDVNPSSGNIQIISDKNKSVTIKAQLQDGSEFNRNKRKYPINILRSGLQKENIRELIKRKSWFGEAGHPINPTPKRQMTVVQENISHRILSYEIVGSKIFGIVKTAPFPMGYAMRDCIIDEDPMESAFSLRAMAPLKETPNGSIVQEPIMIITYDWVFLPSHRKSYQTEIITKLSENHNCLNESCIPLLQEEAISYIKDESKNYKIISEMMEFYGAQAELSEDCKWVSITESTNTSKDKIIIGVEDYISREIMNYKIR